METSIIQAISICVFGSGNKILVQEGYDQNRKKHFYRPLGGKIKFGEKSSDALQREIFEEIGAGIVDVEYLGVIESIFTYNGKNGHEVIFIYTARFLKQEYYNKGELVANENDGRTVRVLWKDVAEFRNDNPEHLFPIGLLDLIDKTKLRIEKDREDEV